MVDKIKDTECTMRFFSIYREKENQSSQTGDYFSKFQYYKNELREDICLKKTPITGADKECAEMLHPQARDFLFKNEETKNEDTSVSRYTLISEENTNTDNELKSELRRSVWRVKAPSWCDEELKSILKEDESNSNIFYFEIKINDIDAFCFPTGILILCIEVLPAFPIPAGKAPRIAQMILNILNRAEHNINKNCLMKRHFSNEKQAISAQERFVSNAHMDLSLGLTGQPIFMKDLFQSLIEDEKLESLMGDRFLGLTFIKTPWQDTEQTFSDNDYIELVRVSRGESVQYKPDTSACIPGQSGICHTFENVVFAISCEGAACWIKPGESQTFLQRQFKGRFQHIYYYLYLLSLHQRYALINLGIELDRTTPPLAHLQGLPKKAKNNDIQSKKEIDDTLLRLRPLRAKVASFYLRAYFEQPAYLTNHQIFYKELQTHFWIKELLNEVQHATSELEYLIKNIHAQKNEEIQNKQLEHMVEHADNELVLTLVVEAAALPYYLFSLLSHALHVNSVIAIIISLAITLRTMFYTYRKFNKDSDPFCKTMTHIFMSILNAVKTRVKNIYPSK